MSHEDRCASLAWSSLAKLGLYFSLIECYKSVFTLINLVIDDLFELASERSSSNLNYKLQFRMSNCNCYKIFILCQNPTRMERLT